MEKLAFMILLMIIFAIVWLGCLINCIMSEFRSGANKMMWILLLLMVAPLGTILYLIFAKDQKATYMTGIIEPRTEKRISVNDRSGPKPF